MAQPETNWNEKLGAILQNPQAMSQILSIAQSLSGSASTEPSPEPAAFQASAPPNPTSENPPPQTSSPFSGIPDTPGASTPSETFLPPGTADSSGSSPLAGLDPRLLAAVQRALAAYQSPGDRRDALLSALKPFLKPERRPRVDKAIQIARLSRVLRSALDGWKGESDHV